MPRYTMSDGREFTDYNPSCELNRMLQNKYKVQNSHEYRYFLQKNAEKVMSELSKMDKQCVFCPVCNKALKQ
jgi:hypothetical protein